MTTASDYYPTSVAGIPKDLTKAGPRYRQLVGVVFVSLILFMLFYLGLLAGSGWLAWYAITYDMGEVNRGTLFLKAASVAMSLMLFLFLLKALFKRQQREMGLQIEIQEAEHPELFGFIRNLCRETGAPFPYRVFLSPDVNACVFYNTSLLNLIFPVRKNLEIGLGLVNALTLCEFKAVLAHEFGHFSQRSMRLGNYVYVANRIIADLVYQRDFWDNLLLNWKNVGDWRLAAPGWLLYGIVWLLRKILGAAFHLINLGEAALSREMEFHADLVAVSVTGSDSLVHALSRLNFANESLYTALSDLKDASDHKLYTKDVYYHQQTAAAHLRKAKDDPRFGMPPPLPVDAGQKSQVFQPDENDIPSMYASHPPNYEREQNAKRLYFRSIQDERSPWILFRNPDAIRQAMTAKFYEEHFSLPQGAVPSEPATVEAFIAEERAETQQDPRYFGLYDGRILEPGDLTQLVHAVYHNPWPLERLKQAYDRLYQGQLKAFAKEHQKRLEEQNLLNQLKSGEMRPRGGTFKFRDQQHHVREAEGLLTNVEQDLEKDSEAFKQLDAEVFQAHYQMARTVGGGVDEELWARYQFHLAAQEILKTVSTELVRMSALLEFLSSREQTSEEDFSEISRLMREARAALANALHQAAHLGLPALRNMQTGARFSDFLLAEPVVDDLPYGSNISGEWVGKLMGQLHEVQSKARRVYSKSLGAILGLQEKIAGQWIAGAR